MIKAIIIEDEAIAARKLQRMLEALEQKVEVITTLESVEQTLAYLPDSKQDLIFMDIHLSDGNVFQVFDEMKVTSPIIFTTAYDKYAIKAFNQNSIHYLLKPIDQSDLQEAVSKFENLYFKKNKQVAARNTNNNTSANFGFDYKVLTNLLGVKKEYQKNYLLQIGQKLKSIDVDSIACFYVKEKTTYLYTFDKRSYPIDLSLSQLESKTDPEQFFRVNRQFLIARKAIEEIAYLSSTRLKITLKPALDIDIYVTIDKIGRFKKWLNQ